MPRPAAPRRSLARAALAALAAAGCAHTGAADEAVASVTRANEAFGAAFLQRLPAFNKHIPPPGMPLSEQFVPAMPPPAQNASNSGNWGKGVCTAGVWQDAPNSALESGGILPSVQCWRNPPCIRWNYATPERCKAWKNDEDWPTTDPHVPSNPPGQHSMKELLDTYWKDKTVVLVGDSINSLIYNAALCEAAKVYDISMGAHAGAGGTGDPGDLHTRLGAFHHKMNELRKKDQEMGGTLWLPNPPAMPQAVAESRTMIINKGWHKWKESDMEGIMAIADVIVVNYGLHYSGDLKEFEDAMPRMFAQLEAFASQPGKAALFRETGSEHKNINENTPEGTFLPSEPNHPDATKVRGCQCGPYPSGEQPLGKRLNALVHDLAVRHPHVGIVPFFDLTAPRHDLHEAGYCAFESLRGKKPADPPPYCCDCTHYCYTPQFWKAFFHNVFNAHAAVVAGGSSGSAMAANVTAAAANATTL